jgi:putative membrane protein
VGAAAEDLAVAAARLAAAAPREDGKMLLSSVDHRRIAEAVAAAEATTRGEIVCVVTDEAGRYAEVSLAWAAAGALLIPVLALAIAQVSRHFDYALGGWAVVHIAAAHAAVLTALTGYASVQGLLFIVILALASIPRVRRRLTPSPLKRAHVRAKAFEHFFARNLDKTRDRTGVLLFVSLKDRRAEILADAGINSKVDPSAWNDVISDIMAGVKSGKPGDGFVAAIERCGRHLTTHFPAGPENSNELPDALTEN